VHRSGDGGRERGDGGVVSLEVCDCLGLGHDFDSLLRDWDCNSLLGVEGGGRCLGSRGDGVAKESVLGFRGGHWLVDGVSAWQAEVLVTLLQSHVTRVPALGIRRALDVSDQGS